MHLVQVCNVGNICGGTAACAWTITRALPHCKHTVLFLSSITEETRTAFHPTSVHQVSEINGSLIQSLKADLILLHNTAPQRVSASIKCPVLVYQHSAGRVANGTKKLICSQWLAQRLKSQDQVLCQPVPEVRPARHHDLRSLDEFLIVGRLCTPTLRKWPAHTIPFYERLAKQFPHIHWEFVGAPQQLHSQLLYACQQRATFYPASWSARNLYSRWHALLYHHPGLPESFGRTVAEAMRAGCIPIVDNQGGFVEQLQPRFPELLCREESDFVNALSLISEASHRWRYSAEVRDEANQRFSLRAFAHQFVAIVEGL